MRAIALLLLGLAVLPAQTGQYRWNHPRLPGPDAAFMQRLQANPTQLAKQIGYADALDPTATYLNHYHIRGAILAWKATQDQNYLNKIIAVANHQMAGFNTKSRLYALAIIYDWMYYDLDQPTRDLCVARIESDLQKWHDEHDVNALYSPYNAAGYNRLSASLVWGAVAIYPEGPNSLQWIQYAAEILVERWLPVWRRYMAEGGWHEGPEYRSYIGNTVYLCMSAASHCSQFDFFAQEPWLRNSLYYPLYAVRPDGSPMRRGDAAGWHTYKSYPFWGSFPDIPALALAYNDPYGLHIATGGNGSDGANMGPAIPSHFPWGPDYPASPVLDDPHELPTHWYYKGNGFIVMRSDWSEDAVYADFGVDPGCWSHSGLDSGHFSIYRRGGLAIDSGAYGSGAPTGHWRMYGSSAAAHNVMLFHDPDDQSNSGQLYVFVQPGTYGFVTAPNDGGFHRHRSGWNGVALPYSLEERVQRSSEFDYGRMESVEAHPEFVYARANLAAAYNPPDPSGPAHINRTHRLNAYHRSFVYLKPDVFVVMDRYQMSKPNVTPRWLFHTINQPSVSGNQVTALRTEAVHHQYGWPALNHRLSDITYYQYDGKVILTSLLPESVNIGTIGGPGQEFLVDGVNQTGHGQHPEYMTPDATEGPQEPGSWRVEITRADAPPQTDCWLNVVQAGTSQSSAYPTSRVTGDELTVGALIEPAPGQYLVSTFCRYGQYSGGTVFQATGNGPCKILASDFVPGATYSVQVGPAGGSPTFNQSMTATNEGLLWIQADLSGATQVAIAPTN